MSAKLYCGTYGKYNNGSIAGKWMKISDHESVKDFFKACKELHKDEQDPEFMFQDYEGFPEQLYSESMSTEEIEKLFIWEDLTEDEQELVTAYLGATQNEFDENTLQEAENNHTFTTDNSSFMSTEEQYGYHLYESGVIEIPDNIETYFDFESFGRDRLMDCAEFDGYIFSL